MNVNMFYFYYLILKWRLPQLEFFNLINCLTKLLKFQSLSVKLPWHPSEHLVWHSFCVEQLRNFFQQLFYTLAKAMEDEGYNMTATKIACWGNWQIFPIAANLFCVYFTLSKIFLRILEGMVQGYMNCLGLVQEAVELNWFNLNCMDLKSWAFRNMEADLFEVIQYPSNWPYFKDWAIQKTLFSPAI